MLVFQHVDVGRPKVGKKKQVVYRRTEKVVI